ncbi:LysR family transcriptional regulator [Castellaniella sp.]|uniref:LysR family transcriptional regulator n=1 Tax=Castellaniella sp. TaxID=1955812 RepID=UPI002AFE92E5|nr:LysR family transcriptional regulator [Castellaniella sp.]
MTMITLHANDLILFAHIVEAGSFTRASNQTGLPKSTLSRRLSSLENAFGERLLQRSTRRLVLTEFGERMLEYARRLMEETEAAAALAQHRQMTPHGTLRVSLPPEFHELFIIRVLTEFSQQYPDVRLELDLSARRVDLIAERFDVAVRIATHLPDDSSLVARRLTTLYSGLYASPAYLTRHGTPQAPDDLFDHVGLALLSSGGEQRPWRLSRGAEIWEGLPLRDLRANSVGLQQALSMQGLGIVGLSDSFTENLVKLGLLARVLPEWSLPPMTVWCVTPGRRLLPQRTIAFIETLKVVLGDDVQA